MSIEYKIDMDDSHGPILDTVLVVFGSGDIGTATVPRKGTLAPSLLLRTLKQSGAIGTKHSRVKLDEMTEGPTVILSFNRLESLDVVLRALQRLRDETEKELTKSG